MAETAISRFDFDLPSDLIAQYPCENRTQSRLLVVGDESVPVCQLKFADLSRVLMPGDLIVCNDSRVIPARIDAKKTTGGRVELLIERIVESHRVWVQAKARRSLRIDDRIIVGGQIELIVRERRRDLFVLELDHAMTAWQLVEKFGRIPLPPYIKRETEAIDRDRYQTVYAKSSGSVAAPTAGLHFSEALLDELTGLGIEVAYLTLHVGAGTFAPIRHSDVNEHVLHSEQYEITPALCESVLNCKARGGRVIAVGTTVVRALEQAAMNNGKIEPSHGETSLFIKPGFQFNAVDALVTNFHLPRSTLLMLVCAFAGRDRVLTAYRYAVSEKFRFYSYGDAMYISRAKVNSNPIPGDCI